MDWEKLGLIFKADNQFDWMCTHAALPIPLHLEGNIFRIFFSTRDKLNRSHGAYLDIDIKNPSAILNLSLVPVLCPGSDGLFDDSGVSLSSYLAEKNLFYYLGWNVMTTVPFSNKVGFSILEENKYCVRVRKTPILQVCEEEPYSFGYPFVLRVGDHLKMWYDTNLCWKPKDMEKYLFVLRSAVSTDGVNWKKENMNCLPMNEGEISISRPCVVNDDGIFKMWYSINFKCKYRIGYAESCNGIQWTRKDEKVGISVSKTGWDSEEIEYPYVFDHDGERYMLYNGNGYGKTGFGLARLIKERS